MTEAQANNDAAVAGPTREERAIADAQVQAAAVAVLERRLEKTILRAPADGAVSVVAAEIGENVRAGQPILMVEAEGKQWLSFNVREDHLKGLAVGKATSVMRNGADPTKAVITELRPLRPDQVDIHHRVATRSLVKKRVPRYRSRLRRASRITSCRPRRCL